jgi:hypothetical protein
MKKVIDKYINLFKAAVENQKAKLEAEKTDFHWEFDTLKYINFLKFLLLSYKF